MEDDTELEYLVVLEAWLKWLRDGEGLCEVSGSSPNGDKNLPIKKKNKKRFRILSWMRCDKNSASLQIHYAPAKDFPAHHYLCDS